MVADFTIAGTEDQARAAFERRGGKIDPKIPVRPVSGNRTKLRGTLPDGVAWSWQAETTKAGSSFGWTPGTLLVLAPR